MRRMSGAWLVGVVWLAACGAAAPALLETNGSSANAERDAVLLRFAPPLGMAWTYEARTDLTLGSDTIRGAILCTAAVTAIEPGIVEVTSAGCGPAASGNAAAGGGAARTASPAVELYDALGRSVESSTEWHGRRSHPVLITFPEAPVRPGDHWRGPTGTVHGTDTPATAFPTELDFVLGEVADGRATISSHWEAEQNGTRAQLEIVGVVDLATGVFLSYAMDLTSNQLDGRTTRIQYEMTTTLFR